ncbi:methylmalonyl-CoA decarboxylase [Selenomonas ruminantium]|uniref:Methylmalonyl-CoA decarboxylase n=1 Tax=Selenomonas ruminantium TaxID=971 RepID=A0A1I3F6R2_SELRU|nr:methylmalonyl-CoA decarboxylase [Selenomonas ruminantium]SFI06853.1 methylmalonyl-CoA decarboxylase [Selenomonas ruminantium]
MLVNTEIKDRIAYVEMQNADHFNCLSEQMCTELIAALDEAYASECVGVVLKAQVKKGVWSAGHDIRELPLDGSDPLGFDVPMEKLMRAVQDVPIPVIACVSGTVWGGACDLCLSCDMIISAHTATFAITPAKIGIPYNASGILHFINQLGMNKAREMFFLGTPITADDALNVGLINHVAEASDLDHMLETKFLAPLRRNSVVSISAIKRQFRILSRASTVISAENFEHINAYRTRVFEGEDYQEGIKAFLEKRPPEYKGKAADLDRPQP